jgi:hypothetical protein
MRLFRRIGRLARTTASKFNSQNVPSAAHVAARTFGIFDCPPTKPPPKGQRLVMEMSALLPRLAMNTGNERPHGSFLLCASFVGPSAQTA